MKAAEREAEPAVEVVGRVDAGVIEDEIECEGSRARITSPIVAIAAGEVQGTNRIDMSATDKEKRKEKQVEMMRSEGSKKPFPSFCIVL